MEQDEATRRSRGGERGHGPTDDPGEDAPGPADPDSIRLGDLILPPAPEADVPSEERASSPLVDTREFARIAASAEVEAGREGAARELTSLDPVPGLREAARQRPAATKPAGPAPVRDAEGGVAPSKPEERSPNSESSEKATRTGDSGSRDDRQQSGGPGTAAGEPRLAPAQAEATLAPAAASGALGDSLSRGPSPEGAAAPAPASAAAPPASGALDGILHQVRLQVRPGLQELTIRLEPPDLGLLHLRFVLEGEQLGVAVLASRADVAAALRTEFRALESTLRDAGIPLDSLEIGVAADPDGRGAARRSFEEEEAAAFPPATAPPPKRTPRARSARPGRLDLLA